MDKLINPFLREEIDLKLKKIQGNPEAYESRKEIVFNSLRSMGDIYSFWIENPSLRKDYLLENKSPKTIKKMARKGIHNVHNAWYFLHELDKYGNFVDKLETSVLERVNGLVKGDKKNKIRSTYNHNIHFNVKYYTPPAGPKVKFKLEEALKRIKNSYSDDPLESAINAHLEIAAIQPFMDGNKRTARLIQDRILYSIGLPPSLISAGESKFYRDLLGKTLPFYDEGILSGQKQFYDYCASKVNNSLDDILGDLEARD